MPIEQIHNKRLLEGVLRGAGEKPVPISFISPKCGHCKRLMTFLESQQQKMPNVIFRIVDVDVSKDLMNEFGIDSVPVTFIFKNGVLRCKVIGANMELLLNNLMEMN
ncbi:thioredoxin-like [Bufo bufo]|uniref:thioredoxin-like n=1 Tax=Bufo bufo TaxID=8384 RepID=UPI001ABE5A4B|nr:thioredoxin-like [Bufo bufo]